MQQGLDRYFLRFSTTGLPLKNPLVDKKRHHTEIYIFLNTLPDFKERDEVRTAF
jgi:hypothetical protein